MEENNSLIKKMRREGWAAVAVEGDEPMTMVAWKPAECGHPEHYNVAQSQVKVSVNLKIEKEIVELPYGKETIQRLSFAVKGRKKA
jgi:hypothetical protein